MRTLSKSSITMAALLGFSLFGFSATAASAEESLESTVDDHYAWFLENGVPAHTAEQLVENMDSGILLDSMSGEDPLAIETNTEAGWIVTRETFEDGSVNVSWIETPEAEAEALLDFLPEGQIAPTSVGSCARTEGGLYWGQYYECAVYGANGYLTMMFYADYGRASGASTIGSVYSPYAYAVGGTAPTPTLSITKSSGTASSPAVATAITQYSSTATSFTATLRLHVSPSSAWSTQTF